VKLWLTDASGNSYKVRVLCSMLNVPYEKSYVDWPSREHKREPFIGLNPRGQVPVMEIEGKVFWDSTAHLVYIARKFGGEQWFPSEPLAMAEVAQWLAFAQNEIHFGLQWARGVLVYGSRHDLSECQENGRKALEFLAWHLGKGNDWLALGRPTIADIACYPYVKRAPEGGLLLEPYPAVVSWLGRCEALPRWLKLD
jgi:glutathione S-transferase